MIPGRKGSDLNILVRKYDDNPLVDVDREFGAINQASDERVCANSIALHVHVLS